MKRPSLAILIILCCSLTVFAGTNLQTKYQTAIGEMNNGLYQAASQHFQAILEEVAHSRGIKVQEAEYSDARKLLNECNRKLKAKEMHVCYSQAMSNMQKKQYRKALENLRKLKQLNGNRAKYKETDGKEVNIDALIATCQNPPSTQPQTPNPTQRTTPNPSHSQSPQKGVLRANISTIKDNGERNIAIITSSTPWNVSKSPDWIECQKIDDVTLELYCEDNVSNAIRVGDVFVKNQEDKSICIHVTQEASPDYMTVRLLKHPDDPYLRNINDFKGLGGNVDTLLVESSGEWYVGSCPDWCSAIQDNYLLNIKLERNDTGAEREASILLYMPRRHSHDDSYITYLIKVTQNSAIPYVEIAGTPINDKSGFGTQGVKLSVSTNAADWDLINLPPWCHIIEKSNTQLILQIDSNKGGKARKADVQAVVGSYSQKFSIIQGALLNYTEYSAYRIKKDDDYVHIEVISTMPWQVANLPAWCHLRKKTSTYVELSIDKNNGGYREDTVTVIFGDDEDRKNVTLKQE